MNIENKLKNWTRKERSFAIFDEKKQLEDSALRRLLLNLGLTPEILGYYQGCFNGKNDCVPRNEPL